MPTAFAQGADITVTSLQSLTLNDVVYLLAALAILGAGALSIIFIFWGGFSFILSGGDETKVKEALHTIRYAIIGLLVAIISLMVVPFIGKLFGINFDFLDRTVLSDQINKLFQQFQTSSTAQPQSGATFQNTAAPTRPELDLESLTR